MDWRKILVSPWKTAFAFAVAAIAVILTLRAQSVLLISFLGLLLGVLMDAVAGLGIRWLRLPRPVGVILAAILFLGAIAGTLILVASPLISQGTELVHSLPQKTAGLSQRLEQYRKQYPFLDRFLPQENSAKNNSSQSSGKSSEVAKKAVGVVSGAFEGAARALATFFLALFLAWDPERWIWGVAQLWPRQVMARRVALFRCIGGALRSYLISIGIAIIAMAVMWSLGLWLIGVEYALLFGVIAGIVEVVPYIGPLLGAVPPFLYALSAGGSKAIYVLLLYAVLHILEGYILVPYVLQEREKLPPPLVVLSILLAGELFGLLGVLLAVPLGTVAYVSVREAVAPSCSSARQAK